MLDQSGPKARSRKSKETKAALIEAARTIIARDGFTNARIVDIAGAAGKAVGLFYTYFPNKYDLFGAVIDEFFSELAKSGADPKLFKEDSRALVRADAESFWETSKKYRGAISGLFEVALTDPELLAIWRKMRARGMERFKRGIRRQQKFGYCRGLDPALAASALLGLLEFACFNWQSGKLDFPDTPIDDKRAIDTLVVIISNALEMGPRSR